MPLYEYHCDACEHQFEALQKMSDEPLVHCPACDEASLRKLVSAAGFRLKGEGWYETDFKSGKKRNLADNGTGADSPSKKSKSTV
ncbi:MAG: putative FmdB family regulatory protein [Methylophagaceae bacterium]|jgi:putative FmdB family regulatory protein